MKMNRARLRTEPPPPPLVPQSVRGWIVPLGRAVLAATGVLLCCVLVLATRQEVLTDTAARHH